MQSTCHRRFGPTALCLFCFLWCLFSTGALCSCFGKGIQKKKLEAPNSPERTQGLEETGKIETIPPNPSDKTAWNTYVQEGWDSPFGLDYVFILGKKYRRPELAYDFGGVVGVRWVNFTKVAWTVIEPRAPKDGRPTYDWSALDEGVRQWQEFGVHILMTLFSYSRWATLPAKDEVFTYLRGPLKWYAKGRVANLPKQEYLKSYRDYIYNLVERYDGDGVRDMPGLRFPILHYQVGNEYCNELFWGGTVQDYGIYLKETFLAARKANEKVKIMLSGVSFDHLEGFYGREVQPSTKAYFDQYLAKVDQDSNIMKALHRANAFSVESMRFCKYFDIVDSREPNYGKIFECKQLLKGFGCPDKEIWSAEVYSTIPIRGKSILAMIPNGYPAPSKSLEYRKILARPKSRAFPVVNAWYRGMQAAQVVKLCMVALDAGAKKLMMGWAVDAQTRLALGSSLSFTGLRSETLDKLWPAAYTYRLLIEKLEGIRSCRRVAMPKNIYVYECMVKKNTRVLVAFYDDLNARNHDEPSVTAQAEVPLSCRRARLTHIITEIDQKEPHVEEVVVKDGKVTLTVSPYPVFIEPIG